jgi:hypothetical protein
MITASIAREMSDDLGTQKSQTIIKLLEARVKEAASQGDTQISVTDLIISKGIELYLENLGYKCAICRDGYNAVMRFDIKW